MGSVDNCHEKARQRYFNSFCRSKRRIVTFLALPLFVGLMFTGQSLASERPASPSIEGHYLEARTCQVYTGPCFANGEMSMAGKDAVLAWKIVRGSFEGVDLTGRSVALVVRASHTLGHQGFENAEKIRTMVLIDENASSDQREGLLAFVRSQAQQATKNIASVTPTKIDLQLDIAELTGELQVDKYVKLKTRKARPGDCICSNESAFYPPLAKLTGSVPGVTIEGDIRARQLGTRWSIPDSRTAYLGTFALP